LPVALYLKLSAVIEILFEIKINTLWVNLAFINQLTGKIKAMKRSSFIKNTWK